MLTERSEELCFKEKYVASCLEKMTHYIVDLLDYSILSSKDIFKGLDLLIRRTRQEIKRDTPLCSSKLHSPCGIKPVQSIAGSSINYSQC